MKMTIDAPQSNESRQFFIDSYGGFERLIPAFHRSGITAQYSAWYVTTIELLATRPTSDVAGGLITVIYGQVRGIESWTDISRTGIAGGSIDDLAQRMVQVGCDDANGGARHRS